MTSRAALAAPLLLQTPPGQFPNVYEDLNGLIGSEGATAQADEEEFKTLSVKIREEHNLEQKIVVDLPNGKGKSILCPSAVHSGNASRFIAPRQGVSFLVDHETLQTSDEKPYKPNSTVEELRLQLEKLLSVYVEDHYPTGLVDVFAVPLPRVQTDESVGGTEEGVSSLQKEVPSETAEDAMEGQEGSEKEASNRDEVINNDIVDNPVTTAEAMKEVEVAKEDNMVGDVLDNPVTTADAMKEVEESKEDNVMDDVVDDPVTTADAMEEVEEAKEDNVMGDIVDNPVTTARAMKEVEESKEESSSLAKEPVEKEDVETQGETGLVVHIVANRYKLNSFWSGRWRSTYTLSSSSATELDSSVNVQIHYFEEGNVQLNSEKSEKLAFTSGESAEAKAKAIVGSIEKFEAGYQDELFKHCNELSEGAFKALRRQLPMTKQKVDWDKVLNYKLGAELTE